MRKAGDIITSLFKNQFGEGFLETARSNAELFSSWEKIVCEVWPKPDNPLEDQEADDVPAAAVHSNIRELERGVLLVEADHPGWIQILQTKQAELLKTVQRRCPELDVRGIAFTLSYGSLSPPAGQYVESVNEKAVNLPAPVSRDEDFYDALKKLEKSVDERNSR